MSYDNMEEDTNEEEDNNEEDNNEKTFENGYLQSNDKEKIVYEENEYKNLIDKINNVLKEYHNLISNELYLQNSNSVKYSITDFMVRLYKDNIFEYINEKRIVLYFNDLNNFTHNIDNILDKIYKIINILNCDVCINYYSFKFLLFYIKDITINFIIYALNIFDKEYCLEFCNCIYDKKQYIELLHKIIYKLFYYLRILLSIYYKHNIDAKIDISHDFDSYLLDGLVDIIKSIHPYNICAYYNIDIIIEYILIIRMSKKLYNIDKKFYHRKACKIFINYINELIGKIYNKKCSIILLQKIFYCFMLLKPYRKYVRYDIIEQYNIIINKLKDIIVYNKNNIKLNKEYNELLLLVDHYKDSYEYKQDYYFHYHDIVRFNLYNYPSDDED